MKRSAPLARRSALVRRTPLQGGQPSKRKTRIRASRRYTGPGPDVMSVIADRSRGLCEIGVVCHGRAPAVDPSHRLAKGMGGTHDARSTTPANNLHACRPCHQVVEGEPARAYANGWKIRRGVVDPTRVPVRHARYGWVLLADDGTWTPAEQREAS